MLIPQTPRLHRLGAGLALLGSLVAVAPDTTSARQQSPTFRARTDLVQIDVVVVDGEGRPVRGLTKDDFRILDRKRQQVIAAFDEVAHERPAAPVALSGVVKDVATNRSSSADRLVMLILDDLHFQQKTDLVKSKARRVVEEIGGQASIGLITTSGVFGVEPTEDHVLLLREIDRFVDRFDPEGRRVHPEVAGRLAMPRLPPPPDAGLPRGDPGDLSRFFGDMTQYRQLQDVAKMIGADDGRRKAFIWISGGNSGPSAQGDGFLTGAFYKNALARLLESLRVSNIATYAIETGDQGPSVLRTVAGETGGFTFGIDQFEQGLSRLIDDLDHYYLLGFSPDDKKGSGYRNVEVRVTTPGLTVRHRRGYVSGPPPTPPRNSTQLARLSAGVRPVAALPLMLQAAALPPIGRGEARVLVALNVTAERAAMRAADGLLRDVLQYAVWAVDLDKKRVVRHVTREGRIILDTRAEIGPPAESVTYQVQAALALPPGRYQLRASAQSAKAAIGGSVYLETDVPDFQPRGLQFGGLVLGRDVLTSVPLAANTMTKNWLPITPALEREFLQSESLRVVCDVAGSFVTVPARLEVDVISREDQRTARVHEQHVDRGERARLDTTVALTRFPAGAYVLRLTATAGLTTVQREVAFAIR